MSIFIEIWGEHSEPKEFFTQKYWPLLSLMKLFKMKKKQNLLHSQFELKKVSLPPSPDASKVHEISDISYPHIFEI